MKSIDDIKQDMSELYDRLKEGQLELKLASELANIAGKNLKAEQLKLAREIFENGNSGLRLLPPAQPEQPKLGH